MKRVYEVTAVIMVILILVILGHGIVMQIQLPKVNDNTEMILPSEEAIYYNSIANINNGGNICEYKDDDILLAMSDGIMAVNFNERQTKIIIRGFAKSINNTNDKIYYLDERNNIYCYDVNDKELEVIMDKSRYASINLVGNILYGSIRAGSARNKNNFGGINFASNKDFFISGTEKLKSGTYYKNKILYLEMRDTDNHVFVSYDLVSKEKTDLFNVDDFAFTWLVDNDKIYYSYSDFSYEVIIAVGKPDGNSLRETNVSSIGIWSFDLNTNENIKIADVSESVLVKNIIDNKLIYCDGPENNYSSWYLLDLVSGGTERFDCDGSCNEIYVAQDMIIIKSTKDGVRKYRFYDENGSYTGFEVLY